MRRYTHIKTRVSDFIIVNTVQVYYNLYDVNGYLIQKCGTFLYIEILYECIGYKYLQRAFVRVFGMSIIVL